jgi:hypothetical protein
MLRAPFFLVVFVAALFVTSCATDTDTQTTPDSEEAGSQRYRKLSGDQAEEPWQASTDRFAPRPTDIDPQADPGPPDADTDQSEVKKTEAKWRGRFVLKELMPVVDPEMLDARQIYMGIDPRIHRSRMDPSLKGGITKTRVAFRSEKEDSEWVILVDKEPAYRMFVVIRWLEMVPTLSWAGAEHVLLGTVSFGRFTFDSDPSFPLHFKLVNDVGYVYLCGCGTVTTAEGEKHSLGEVQSISDLILDLAAEDQLTREAASEALGWLAKTEGEIDVAVPGLVKALKDDAMEVRRNAAAALGRIGDVRAREGLKAALQDEDEWVLEVVADALKKLEDV